MRADAAYASLDRRPDFGSYSCGIGKTELKHSLVGFLIIVVFTRYTTSDAQISQAGIPVSCMGGLCFC